MQALRAPKPDPEWVLAKALNRTGDRLGLKAKELAQAIGCSEAQMSRIANGKAGLAPSSKSGEMALLLIRVFRSLDALVGGDDEKRRLWMSTHNRALAGTPTDLVKKADGLVRTVDYLDGMRAPI
jgi:transcriptional regulator with XRE-family HTH domain